MRQGPDAILIDIRAFFFSFKADTNCLHVVTEYPHTSAMPQRLQTLNTRGQR